MLKIDGLRCSVALTGYNKCCPDINQYTPFVRQICFVTNKYNDNIVASLCSHVINPLGCLMKWRCIWQIRHQQNNLQLLSRQKPQNNSTMSNRKTTTVTLWVQLTVGIICVSILPSIYIIYIIIHHTSRLNQLSISNALPERQLQTT